MEHFTIDSVTFRRFRHRFNKWMSKGMIGLPEAMTTLMPLFNNLQKVVPMFSYLSEAKKDGRAGRASDAYFVLMVEEGGYDELATFFKSLEKRIQALSDDHSFVQVSLSVRTRPFRWAQDEDQVFYHGHVLSMWPLHTKEKQDLVLNELRETLMSLEFASTNQALIENSIRTMEELVGIPVGESSYRKYLAANNYSKEAVGVLDDIKLTSLMLVMLIGRFIDHGDIADDKYAHYKKIITDLYKPTE